MADKKISELDAITGAATAADDFFIVVDTSGSATKKISRAELNNAIEQDVLAQVDITSANIDGGTIDNTPIGATTPSTGDFTTVDTTGDVTVGGNLTVNGTTTTVNSTTLDVDDINITVASGAADAAAADGAGLTVDGASATFNYASTGDKWTMNKPLDVTGTVTATSFSGDGSSLTGISTDLVGDTTPQLGGDLDTNGNDITFGDNDKAIFGASSDLQIYHDGSNSILKENGAGGVLINNPSDLTLFNANVAGGVVKLFHVGSGVSSEKLATTATGIDVTGTVTADGLTVDSGVARLTTSYLAFSGQVSTPSEGAAIYRPVADSVAVSTNNNQRLLIASNGDISFYDSTGVTQGLFWDASTQRLGLGTTSPGNLLEISGSSPILEINSTAGVPELQFSDGGVDEFSIQYDTGTNALRFVEGGVGAHMVIKDGGNVGIGTSSPSTIIHAVAAGGAIRMQNSSGTAKYIQMRSDSTNSHIEHIGGPADALRINNQASGQIEFLTANTERMRIDSSGNVGIGTSSPQNELDVRGTVEIGNGSTQRMYLQGTGDDFRFYDRANLSERLRITSAGRVGIGVSSPDQQLHISGTFLLNNNQEIRFKDSGGSQRTAIAMSSNDLNIGTSAGGNLKFYNGSSYTERLRIDSSGNVLTAKTSSATNTVGHEIRANGVAYHTRDAGLCLLVNRKTSDGAIIQVRKDDGVVGSIGTNGGRVFVSGPAAGGIKFDQYGPTNGAPLPCTSTGAKADNLHDFGVSDARWDDIYATNGTIQTSDQNEKQQIASLTDAEITAAKAISQLFKTFKWNDKVAAKGDAARRHTGVVAQDVEAAMTAAGLDAGDYAFFISASWWEADGETYYNADDAPEGATEHNRKGIRYPELLSFVGAATEQRLANIETRLTALEAN